MIILHISNPRASFPSTLSPNLLKERLHVLEAESAGGAALGRGEVEVEVRDGPRVADGAAVPPSEGPTSAQWERFALPANHRQLVK